MQNKTWAHRLILSSCVLGIFYFAFLFFCSFNSAVHDHSSVNGMADEYCSYSYDTENPAIKAQRGVKDIYRAGGYKLKKRYFIASRAHEKLSGKGTCTHPFDYSFFAMTDGHMQRQPFTPNAYLLRPSYYNHLFLRALF